MKAEFRYSVYEPYYGSPHIKPFSPEALQKEMQDLSKIFLGINFGNEEKNNFDGLGLGRLLRFLEIMKYGKEKYQILFSFNFDAVEALKGRYRLLTMDRFNDPHYEVDDGMPSAFEGDILSIVSLFDVRKNPGLFTGTIKKLVDREVQKIKERSTCEIKQKDFRPATRIFIGGTRDAGLIIGIPNKIFLASNKPIRG